MKLAKNYKEVFEQFDFTDSIITNIEWENNLFDLCILVDYYWDIQEGKEDTRILKIIFTDCVKADFQNSSNLLTLSKDEIHPDSWFTIVRFTETPKSDLPGNYKHDDLTNIEIYTLDSAKPWLSIISRGVKVEEIEVK